MGFYKPFKDVLKNSTHYVALGQTDIFLEESDPDLPWSEVVRVEAGGGYRLNGPTGFRCIAERDGLTFNWSVDFETREANGASVHLFDRDRMRMTMQKLPPKARKALADFMEKQVLPGVEKVTTEWRGYLNKQLDSEDCVRGLIEFARR